MLLVVVAPNWVWQDTCERVRAFTAATLDSTHAELWISESRKVEYSDLDEYRVKVKAMDSFVFSPYQDLVVLSSTDGKTLQFDVDSLSLQEQTIDVHGCGCG